MKTLHQGTKQLETERLILRRFTTNDAKKMFDNWSNDKEVTRFLPWPTHQNISETEELLKLWEKEYASDTTYQWAIAEKETNELIGSTSITIYDDLTEGEIGYCLSKKAWGKGYATEITKALIDFSFHHIHLKRIFGKHSKSNTNSGQVMLKAGFTFWKIVPNGYSSNFGTEDAIYYEITND